MRSAVLYSDICCRCHPLLSEAVSRSTDPDMYEHLHFHHILLHGVFDTVTDDTKKTDSNFHRESMGNAESAVSDVPFL